MTINPALGAMLASTTATMVDMEQCGVYVAGIVQRILDIGGTIMKIVRDTMCVSIMYAITYEEVFLQGIPPQVRETWRVLRVTAGSEAPGTSQM